MHTFFRSHVQLLTCAAWICLVAPPNLTACQDSSDPTAEQVLDQYANAIGGSDARAKLKTRISKGDVSFEFGPQSIEATFSIYQHAPDRSRIEIELSSLGTVVSGFDGKQGWTVGGQGGDQLFDKARNENAAVTANFFGLAQWRNVFSRAEFQGKVDVDGTAMYKVACFTASGKKYVYFFNQQTGLLVKSINPNSAPQVPADEIEIHLSDYREFDGVKYPMTVKQIVRNVNGGDLVQSYQYKSVEHGAEIDPSKFAVPKHLKKGVDG